MRTLLTLTLLLTASPLVAQEKIEVPVKLKATITLPEPPEPPPIPEPYNDTELRNRLGDLESRVKALESDPVDPPDPVNPLDRPVVGEDDLRFVGAFGVAGYTVNGKESKFTNGGFTHRIVGDGSIEFLATGHAGTSLIYSFPMRELSTSDDRETWAVAPTSDVTEAEGNSRPFKLIREASNQLSQHAIFWSPRDSRLYTAGRHAYNATGVNYPSLAAMLPSGESVGPWKTVGAHNQWVAGGIDDIPRWFADQYLDGMDLSMGAGGRMSGQGASQGPALAAVQRPDETTVDTIQAKTLLHFPWGSEHWERRSPDYIRTTDHWLGRVPNEDHGWFTAMDHVRDHLWIDLPGKQGVMFVPHLGHGEIQYIDGSVRASEGQSSSFYIYSMADLARVAKGELQPYEINATSYWPAGFRGQCMGLTMIDRRIYVLVKSGGPKVGIYSGHGVYVFEITEN